MAITYGGLIEYTDYNTIRNKINDILGVGSSDYGYGQTVTSQTVSQNAIIGHLEWNNLRADMAKIKTHQTGITVGTTRGSNDGNNLVNISSTDTITYQDIHQYQLFANTIDTNRFLIASSQKSTDTTTFTQSTDWNGTLQFATQATASSATNMRYFFNTGGYIEWTLNITDGAAGTKQHDWAVMINNAVFKIDHANIYVNSSVNSANGWYNLTTGVEHILTFDSVAFPGNQLKIYITKDSDITLSIACELIDGDTSNGDANITGTTVLSMTQTYSSGSVTVDKLALSGEKGAGALPLGPALLSLVANKSIVAEGSTILVTATVSNTNGATYYWGFGSLSGGLTESDFIIPPPTVSNNLSSEITTQTFTVLNNGVDNPLRTFTIQVFTDAAKTIPFGSATSTITIPAQATYVYNTTSDNWNAFTIPQYVNEITIDMIGGSGGTYGWHDSGYNEGQRGGGVGGAIKDVIYTVSPGDVISVLVGAQGGSGYYNGGTGATGTSSAIYINAVQGQINQPLIIAGQGNSYSGTVPHRVNGVVMLDGTKTFKSSGTILTITDSGETACSDGTPVHRPGGFNHYSIREVTENQQYAVSNPPPAYTDAGWDPLGRYSQVIDTNSPFAGLAEFPGYVRVKYKYAE